MTSSYQGLDSYLRAEQNRIGQVLGYGSGEGITYLSGEISRAYGSKVRGYSRSFVFVEFPEGNCPAALFVYDDITSADKNYKKFWLCHGIHPPVTEGSRSTFSVTERGYNGRLTVDTLLPKQENLEVSAILDPMDFDVFGTKYPAVLFENRRNDCGACRIMVSPRDAREQDHFLHVLQVSDGDAAAMEQPELLEGDGIKGAILRGTAVIFVNKDVKNMDLILPRACDRIVLCGISGQWQFGEEKHSISQKERVLVLQSRWQISGKCCE